MLREGKLRPHFNALNGGGKPTAPYRRVSLPINKTYCILMTPRSGSTWLTRRIARLDALSCPDEHFNSETFGTTLKFNPGRDIYEVFDIIAGKNCTSDGLFGFEISYFDLEEFEREARLLDVMVGEKHFFYLNRRNFVAQAISLHTAVESRVFHVYPSGEPPPHREVPYDDEKILFWACHILQQEFGITQWIAANRIYAVRLRYEELVEDIDAVIARMAVRLGIDLNGAAVRAVPETQRATLDCAAQYEHRFRDRHPEFCRKWEALRGIAPCPYTADAAWAS